MHLFTICSCLTCCMFFFSPLSTVCLVSHLSLSAIILFIKKKKLPTDIPAEYNNVTPPHVRNYECTSPVMLFIITTMFKNDVT